MPVAKTKKTTTRRTTTRRVVRKTEPVTMRADRPMIDPIMAIKNFWTRYFDFMGRSTRSEFWFGVLFAIIVNMLFARFVGGIVSTVVSAVLFIPLMALTVRRFRDAVRGKEGRVRAPDADRRLRRSRCGRFHHDARA